MASTLFWGFTAAAEMPPALTSAQVQHMSIEQIQAHNELIFQAAREVPTLAKVFLIEVDNEGISKNCSATLLYLPELANDPYRLVTNAHCMDGPIEIRLHVSANMPAIGDGEEQYFAQSKSPQVYITQLRNLDRTRDLAELEIPPQIRQQFCNPKRLLPSTTNFVWPGHGGSFISVGFHAGTRQVAYTRGYIWPDFGQAATSIDTTSLANIMALMRIDHLQMLNGMSGGLVTNGRQFVGINVRFIPFQEATDVIVASDVAKFLTSTPWKNANAVDLSSGEGENTSVDGGENSGTHGGENSGTHGGENSGTHGGENSGTHGGEKHGGHGDLRLRRPPSATSASQKQPDPNDVLAAFREPDEGVDVTTSQGTKHLLALSTHQVDGFDAVKSWQDSKSKPLFRDSKEFEAAKLKFFKRLAGTYGIRSQGGLNSAEKIYERHYSNTPYLPFAEGEPFFGIEFTVKSNNAFTLVLTESNFRLVGSNDADRNNPLRIFGLNEAAVDGRIETYQGTLSKDGSTITMQSPTGVTLVCPNHNFLKIICSSTDPLHPEELSLSLTDTEPVLGQLNLRTSRLIRKQINGVTHDLIQYRYGTIWRHFP